MTAGGRMVMKRPMVAFLIQLLCGIRSRFTGRARLEAENLLLRQQLIVLRRESPTRVRLWNIDRLLLVWLYRLYPSVWHVQNTPLSVGELDLNLGHVPLGCLAE